MHFSIKTLLFVCICLWTHSCTLCFNIKFGRESSSDLDSDFLSNNPNLPEPEDFIATLLNVTVNQVITIAKNFVFSNSSAIEKVKILRYEENGKYTNYTLAEEIPVDPSQQIKIVIHGWKSQGTADWVKNITNSYQKLGVSQTIAVDWSAIADENYLKAAGCVEHVGVTLADYVWRMILKENVRNLGHIHLIGHSLGAQVSGFFGKYIQKVSGGKRIYRISALDAAAPLFEYPIHQPSTKRIDEDDADFVAGFHTNAGFLGFLSPFGNQDYYVSYGGPIQPGCADVNIIKAFECSHSRSHFVYNLTILTDEYLARHCDSSLLMFAKLCEKNILAVVGEQNNSTDINGQFFIYVNGDGIPIYPWEQHGILTSICNGIRNFFGDVLKTVNKIF